MRIRHGIVLRMGTAKGTLWTPLKRRSPRRGIGMVVSGNLGFRRARNVQLAVCRGASKIS